MAEFVALGSQIVGVVITGIHHQGDPFFHLKSIAPEPSDLAGVVGQQSQAMDAEIREDLRPHPVVAQVSREPQPFVGFNGVQASILKAVGAKFVDQTDAAALLAEVNHHTFPLTFDLAQCCLQLRTAVAAQGSEGITGEAFRMHPHQHWFTQGGRVAFDEGHMFRAIQFIAVADGLERTELTRQFRMGLPSHKPFVVEPVTDQFSDADQLQAPGIGVSPQFRQTGHGAIAVLDLADHAGGCKTRKLSQVNSCFSVSGAFQHAARLGPQRKNVSRSSQLRRSRLGIEGNLNRPGTILRRDSSADAVLSPRIDAHREGRFVGIGVAIHHQGEIELVQPLPLHGQTDQPAGLGRHEIDRFRCGELSGADQIAFVFTLLVIDHHHTGTIANGGQRLGDVIEADLIVLLMLGTGVQKPAVLQSHHYQSLYDQLLVGRRHGKQHCVTNRRDGRWWAGSCRGDRCIGLRGAADHSASAGPSVLDRDVPRRRTECRTALELDLLISAASG